MSPASGRMSIVRMGFWKSYKLRSVTESDTNALTGSLETAAMRFAMETSFGAVRLLSMVSSS